MQNVKSGSNDQRRLWYDQSKLLLVTPHNYIIPANTTRRNNVVTRSLQRRDFAATLSGRCVFAGIILVCRVCVFW